MKPSVLKQMAAQGALIMTLIVITGAIIGAMKYFASQEELKTVQKELKRQKQENDCRTWLIKNILDRRINIFEKEDTYVALSKASDILKKMEESKTGALNKDDKRKANEANKELADMQGELEQIKKDEHKLRRILDQPTVLTESGECIGGR